MNVAAATQDTFRAPGAREALHYLRVLIPVIERGRGQPTPAAALQPPQRVHEAARARPPRRGARVVRLPPPRRTPQTCPVFGKAPSGCDPMEPWSLGGRPAAAFQRLTRAPVVCGADGPPDAARRPRARRGRDPRRGVDERRCSPASRTRRARLPQGRVVRRDLRGLDRRRAPGRRPAAAPPARDGPGGDPGLVRTRPRASATLARDIARLAAMPLAAARARARAPGRGALARRAALAAIPDGQAEPRATCGPRSRARACASTGGCACAASTRAAGGASSSAAPGAPRGRGRRRRRRLLRDPRRLPARRASATGRTSTAARGR